MADDSCVDYLELKNLLDIDVINYDVHDQSSYGRLFRYQETQFHSDLHKTLLGLLQKHHYRLIFTMSERAGIPYAGLHRLLPGRRPFVSMIPDRQPIINLVSLQLAN